MPVDAIAMLKADHQRIRELICTFKAGGDRDRKATQRIVNQVFQDLQVHGILEEQIFYPAVHLEDGRQGREFMFERLDEHRTVEVLIDELMDLDVGDGDFADRFNALLDMVERHIALEEANLMPEVQMRLGSEELEDLASDMQELRREILEVPRLAGKAS